MKKITSLIMMPVILLILVSLHHEMKAEEITKVLVEKTYDVNADAKLVVRLEHGNVKCNNWDKNEISIKLTARTNASSQEKADKAFGRVSWDVQGSQNEVLVESKINNKGNGSKHTNISVDLVIYLPKSVSLDFNHKFGNAYIEEVEGLANVQSEYGSITVGALGADESRLKIEFGSGKINRFGNGSMGVEYGKLTVGTAGKVDVKAEYSEFNADEFSDLSLSSEGGNAQIGKVNNLNGKSEFGNLEVDELTNSMDIKSEYGSLIVRHVDQNFSNISIVNEYGSVKLYIPDDATYQIDAQSEYGSIKYPESMAEFTYRVKSHGDETYRGVIGKGSSPTSKLTITNEYGNISLIAK